MSKAAAEALRLLAEEIDARFFREPEVHLQKHIVDAARRAAQRAEAGGRAKPKKGSRR